MYDKWLKTITFMPKKKKIKSNIYVEYLWIF